MSYNLQKIIREFNKHEDEFIKVLRQFQDKYAVADKSKIIPSMRTEAVDEQEIQTVTDDFINKLAEKDKIFIDFGIIITISKNNALSYFPYIKTEGIKCH